VAACIILPPHPSLRVEPARSPLQALDDVAEKLEPDKKCCGQPAEEHIQHVFLLIRKQPQRFIAESVTVSVTV